MSMSFLPSHKASKHSLTLWRVYTHIRLRTPSSILDNAFTEKTYIQKQMHNICSLLALTNNIKFKFSSALSSRCYQLLILCRLYITGAKYTLKFPGIGTEGCLIDTAAATIHVPEQAHESTTNYARQIECTIVKQFSFRGSSFTLRQRAMNSIHESSNVRRRECSCGAHTMVSSTAQSDQRELSDDVKFQCTATR